MYGDYDENGICDHATRSSYSHQENSNISGLLEISPTYSDLSCFNLYILNFILCSYFMKSSFDIVVCRYMFLPLPN